MSEPRYTLDDFNTIASISTGYESLNGQPPAERDSWQPINLAGLPHEPPVKPTLGGFGIVYHGRRHVFSGPQESAKTLAAYAIGLEAIRQGHTITIIDFEMGAYTARNRLQELGATPDELGSIHYLEPHDPATPDRISALIALAPTLVIIDAAAGAYDLQSLDDNKRQDVERFTNLYIAPFWRAGIATIVLDHVVKNTETRGKYAIGSERKTGGVDVHLGFDTILPIKRGSTGLYKIVTHKDRDGYLQRGRLADLHLTSHPDTHQISWEWKQAEHVEPGETWMPTKVMEKISRQLALHNAPQSRIQIITAAGGSKDVARKAIEHLIALGYATETAGARGAKLVEHNLTYTAETDENDNDLTDLTALTSPDLELTSVSSTRPDLPSPPPYRGTGQVERSGQTQIEPKPQVRSEDDGIPF